jgi:serine/threonine protein kinase
MRMNAEACPTNQELAQLAGGQLPEALAAALAEHIQACPRCLPALEQVAASLQKETAAAQLGGGRAEGDALLFLDPAAGRKEIGRLAHYRILKKLGEGGMGMVLLAEDTQLERPVALKVIRPEIAKDAEARQRFLREARAMAQVRSDHVVTVYHVGQVGQVCFIAMELLEGQSLEAWLEQELQPPLDETLRIGREIAQALAAAQARGLIHRDIKPANVWLEAPARRAKVLDFGLARPQTADAKLTTTGAVMGTPAYMAPEQALGEAVDGRADLYSLGCVLYEMVCGRLPFEAPTIMAMLKALTTRTPEPPSRHSPDLPAPLDHLIVRLLAKEPADRPGSAQAVVAELQAIERQLLVPACSPVRPASVPVPSPPAASPDDLVWSAKRSTPSSVDAPSTVLRAREAPKPGKAGVPGTAPGRTVLLVEPSRSQAVIIRGYLQNLGLQDVRTLPSGQAALEAARADPPGVVISAMHLADMTGAQLAQKLRAEPALSSASFVLISSQADAHEANLSGKVGDPVRLPKPFDQAQLAQALAAAAGGQTPPSATETRGRLRVLIVDDSAPARLHIREVLQRLGLSQFVEAADGARAVAAVARESFDLIVTDYNMPYMDGGALVAYLKQNPSTASVPIILVTTEQDPGKLDAVRRLGVAAVCDKSFPPDVTDGILDRLVRRA